MRLINPEEYEHNRDMLNELDDENVLVGPDRDPEDADVDRMFGSEFSTSLRDCLFDADHHGDDIRDKSEEDLIALLLNCGDFENPIIEIDDANLIIPILASEGYEIGAMGVQRQEDLTWDATGIFFGPTLVVQRKYQGQGIGKALVAARLLKDGALLTWEHDTPGYSPAGEGTVIAGLDLAKDLLGPAPGPKI
jgi:GNAT superfamily N-acetyltransferase